MKQRLLLFKGKKQKEFGWKSREVREKKNLLVVLVRWEQITCSFEVCQQEDQRESWGCEVCRIMFPLSAMKTCALHFLIFQRLDFKIKKVLLFFWLNFRTEPLFLLKQKTQPCTPPRVRLGGRRRSGYELTKMRFSEWVSLQRRVSTVCQCVWSNTTMKKFKNP